MSCFQIKLGVFAVVVLLLCNPAISWQVDAYVADTIWTGDGEPIHDAVLVVVDGKVQTVGPRDSVAIPANARQHSLAGRSIMPGIVVAKTQLAGTQDAPKTLTPQIMAIDGFDFFADQSAYLESGITSAQISAGENRLMPGVGAVVKLSGDDLANRLLLDRESMRIVLDDNARKPPRIYEPQVGPVSEDRPLEPTRPQLSTLAGSLAGLRLLFTDVPDANDSATASQDEVITALAQHLQDSGVVRISAKTAPEIRGAIGLAKQFGFQVILTDCQDLEPFVDDFPDWSSFVKGVVLVGLSPGKITNPTTEELKKQNEPWEFTRELLDAGIPVAVQPGADEELKDILFVAGQFMKDDLSQNQLVSMLTHVPAKMLGVDDRVGQLAAGKDADFVILNNAPFALHTAVMATYVDGEPVFDRAAKTKTTVVRAGKVYTGDGHIIDNARIVVKGKTVRGIGADVSAPVDAEVRNYADAVIVPGFVDLGTGIGLGGPLSGSVRMNTKLGEQLYADDPAIKFAREQGVTTVLLGSMSSSSGTPLVAFKLGDDVRVIADPVAIRFKVSDNTATSIAALKKTLQAGKAYHESFIKYDKDLAAYNEKQEAQKKLAAEEAKAQAAEKAKAEKAKQESAESK
ncbi:MAG: amidohydrolase family protein, partial [Pirellulaceae bacterium]|nr:amidohydrolase family protein [Pirellulaceae bacterium]